MRCKRKENKSETSAEEVPRILLADKNVQPRGKDDEKNRGRSYSPSRFSAPRSHFLQTHQVEDNSLKYDAFSTRYSEIDLILFIVFYTHIFSTA